MITKLEASLDKYGLSQEEIKIRMTGCPNGCGRSVLGEIGLIGKSPGRYNLYLGASFNGDRLNTLYRENQDEKAILSTLDGLFESFANTRRNKEKLRFYPTYSDHCCLIPHERLGCIDSLAFAHYIHAFTVWRLTRESFTSVQFIQFLVNAKCCEYGSGFNRDHECGR